MNPRRPSEYKDYPTCHRLQVISATGICATHTHLQMEVPKLLLRISAIEGQVPGSTDLPLQKLPYAVLGLIRSRPFPCNHSPPRCRPWTTLHPHPIHRVYLPPNRRYVFTLNRRKVQNNGARMPHSITETLCFVEVAVTLLTITYFGFRISNYEYVQICILHLCITLSLKNHTIQYFTYRHTPTMTKPHFAYD
jgi:hypothetical protein